MKIVVLLKQIADPNIITFDIIGERLCYFSWILNPVDRHALEAALQLKEAWGGEVIAVSVAPERADGILRHALKHGADRAVRYWDNALEKADTWVISGVIAAIVKKTGFDLIVCGSRSMDAANRLMGPALAEELDLPLVTNVIAIELKAARRLQVERKLEKGRRETYSFDLPGVVTVEEGANDPRYVAPHSRSDKEGMEKPVETIRLEKPSVDFTPLVSELNVIQARPRTKVGVNITKLSAGDRQKLMRGELGRKREIFRGSPDQGARKIIDIVKENLPS